MQEHAYWSQEVAKNLGISESTLRKYCIILEKSGWRFLRDAQGRRAFRERDVMMLRKFMELAKNENITLEEAAKAVLTLYIEKSVTDVTLPVTLADQRHNERYEELIEKLERLAEMNAQHSAVIKELIERMDRQQRFIEEKLLERDRQLLDTIRQLQEPKKRWWQFWKK